MHTCCTLTEKGSCLRTHETPFPATAAEHSPFRTGKGRKYACCSPAEGEERHGRRIGGNFSSRLFNPPPRTALSPPPTTGALGPAGPLPTAGTESRPSARAAAQAQERGAPATRLPAAAPHLPPTSTVTVRQGPGSAAAAAPRAGANRSTQPPGSSSRRHRAAAPTAKPPSATRRQLVVAAAMTPAGRKRQPQRQPPPDWLSEAAGRGGRLPRSKLETDWLSDRRFSFGSAAPARPCAPWRSTAGYGGWGGSRGAERANAAARGPPAGPCWEVWG